jgi:dienelactone hydrolase
MARNLLKSAAAVGLTATAMFELASTSAPAQIPRTSGYKDVIEIPVDDPKTKAIAGALFKPAGAGPFPAVIYMGTCAGPSSGEERFVQTALRDRLLSRGFALLIVDPYSPRQEWQGVCDKAKVGGEYDTRGVRDIYAATDVLATIHDIDTSRIFVQGYSLGASAALSAIDARSLASHKERLAGVIAFSPYCGQDAALSAPALILIGDKDLWASAKRCQALERSPSVKVVVYAGVGHGFSMPFGHHAQYDHDAAGDAKGRAEAFLDAHTVIDR